MTTGHDGSGMRRSALAATLVLAILAGGGVGATLHAIWPDPFQRAGQDRAASGPRAPAPSTTPPSATSPFTAAPSGSPASSDPPTASGSASPSATGRRPSAPTRTPRRAPAFTHLALLTPPEFLQRGWGAARVVDRFDHIPEPAVTPCATVTPDQPGLRSGFAATYASERTEAAEEVARFDTTARAEDAFATLRATVAGCADASAAADRLRVVDAHHPSDTGAVDVRWWNTRALDGGAMRGVVGVVRVDDRVAVLSLRSDVTDPAETTRIEDLLVQAGRRLV